MVDIHLGQYVESYTPGSGAIQIKCPGCNHYTPIARADLRPDESTSLAPWIDCACQRGDGLPLTTAMAISDCPCVARYRVKPSGTGGRYIVTHIDLPTIHERQIVRRLEAQRIDEVVARVFGPDVTDTIPDDQPPMPQPPRSHKRKA